MNAPLALYVHWPFCLSKCPYCDFNSRAMPQGVDQKAWAEAYVQDLTHYAQRLPNRELTSIYFGGGTPSLMEAATVEAILNAAAKSWEFSDDIEITSEANPSSATEEKLKAFRGAGVNRVSLGVQSFDDKALSFLGRAHNGLEACHAIERVASLYDRFSFDLIYARTGQTLAAWEEEMQQALSFAPKHLSLYQLTIEPRTAFYKRAENETLIADEPLAVDMYELTQNFLAEAGLPAYEVSNHAAAGEESRHNLTYWHYEDYIGIGPGAHGRFVDANGRIASEATANPTAWLAGQSPRSTQEPVGFEEAKQEALMMGLRLFVGINKKQWHQKFDEPLDAFVPKAKTSVLVSEGLLVDTNDVLRTTFAGMQRLNAVLNFSLSS